MNYLSLCVWTVVSAQALVLVSSTSLHKMRYQMGALGYALLWNNLTILENGNPHEIFAYFIQRRLYELIKKVRHIMYLTKFAQELDGDSDGTTALRTDEEDFNEKAPPVRQPPSPKI